MALPDSTREAADTREWAQIPGKPPRQKGDAARYKEHADRLAAVLAGLLDRPNDEMSRINASEYVGRYYREKTDGTLNINVR